jgi:hypothetical protein
MAEEGLYYLKTTELNDLTKLLIKTAKMTCQRSLNQ